MSRAAFLSLMLASGGDRRIVVPRGGNTNQYGASPYPRSTLGYAASTANDISLPAFRHLESLVANWPAGGLIDACSYADRLEDMRGRLRDAWKLDAATDIVFAPSGTDLEYVALALAQARGGKPVTNILLGQDEVGSGCVHSAGGRYFARETALLPRCEPGAPLDGFVGTRMVSLALRREDGTPVSQADMLAAIDAEARAAIADGRHVLCHVVHGSKTGLVRPDLSGIDTLLARHGANLTLVVDACQARIDSATIRQYLSRGAIVLLTGSKFIGGPPFSGMALVPPALRPRSPIAKGLAFVFRRAEWSAAWAGCDHLPASANPGLLLRLEAAVFELEHFARIAPHDRSRVISTFGQTVRGLTRRLGAALVDPALAKSASGGAALHESTLATIDLSNLPGQPDLATTQRWCRVLAARGLRLGQPVKWLRRTDGRWAGNLRISLSMPMIGELAELDAPALDRRLERDMARIAEVLEAAQRPVVA